MDYTLQIILIISSFVFLVLIFSLVHKTKISLKYALTWLGTGISFLVLGIFPNLVYKISELMHIVTPINALFLIIIAWLIIIILTITIVVTKQKREIVRLVQRLAILENERLVEKINE